MIRLWPGHGRAAMNTLENDTAVTTIIRQRPKPDAADAYEAWLKEITPLAGQFAGHQGVNIIRPHGVSDAYTVALHFER
jgi:antibiotic biosynthesis monooxygenase (ABM) superfamily enzyme